MYNLFDLVEVSVTSFLPSQVSRQDLLHMFMYFVLGVFNSPYYWPYWLTFFPRLKYISVSKRVLKHKLVKKMHAYLLNITMKITLQSRKINVKPLHFLFDILNSPNSYCSYPIHFMHTQINWLVAFKMINNPCSVMRNTNYWNLL